MIKPIWSALALAVLLAHPASAQLHPLNSASTITARGAEARATVRIAIGSRSQIRSERQPVRFDLTAGPSVRLADGSPIGRSTLRSGEGLRLSFAPGHSTRLAIGGVPLVTRYANSRVAAAEEAGSGGGISGWAIAGGVLVVGLGVAYLALEDAIDCNENGEYICE